MIHLRHNAAGALALAFSMSSMLTSIPANAAGHGALAGGIGGTVAGTVSSASSAAVGTGLSAGDASFGMAGRQDLSGTGGLNANLNSGATRGSANLSDSETLTADASVGAWTSAFLKINGSMHDAIAVATAQQVVGQVKQVANGTVAVLLRDGRTVTYRANGDIASALRALVGKVVAMRSADGRDITSLIGQAETVRGIVVAMQGNAVAFLSPTGEVHVITLAKGGVERLGLRTGAFVLFKSEDFGKTASLAVMDMRRGSMLGDVFEGKIAMLTAHTVQLATDTGAQTFACTQATAHLLKSLAGKIVALDSPDGLHVKSVLSAQTLASLLNETSGRVAADGATANVLAATAGTATFQFLNGDVATYAGSLASLGLQPGAIVRVKPIDGLRAILSDGKHAVSVTRSAFTRAGHSVREAIVTVIAKTPTAMTVQYANGDVQTLLGDVDRIDAAAGSKATVQLVDASHVALKANASDDTLVDAGSCRSIGLGCHAEYGVIGASTAQTAQVTLADGEKLQLRGNFGTHLGTNVAVIVQPLDHGKVLVKTNDQVVGAAEIASGDVSSR